MYFCNGTKQLRMAAFFKMDVCVRLCLHHVCAGAVGCEHTMPHPGIYVGAGIRSLLKQKDLLYTQLSPQPIQ